MSYDYVPSELKAVNNWVCWTADKLPKNPKTGGNAQSNNKSTWGTFEQAVAAVDMFKFDGIGFMFAPPYFGVDLDHCIDNEDFCNEFVDGLQTYNEYSRSGTGIHMICKGTLPDGSRRRNNIEMYSEGRYFIVTGKPYNNAYAEIKDCSETIKPLRAKYLPDIRPAVAAREVTPLYLSDEEIIEKARNSKSGSLFQLLYSGQWQGLYPSQSEADIAFCNMLAFWCRKDTTQMDRIFRSSDLFRDKWERKQAGSTYGEITLERAKRNCMQVYEPQYEREAEDVNLAANFFNNITNEIAKKYDMNDTGNAQRFRDKYKGNVLYSYSRKKWFFWTGKQWKADDCGAIKVLADGIVEDLKSEAFNCEDEDEMKEKIKFANKTANSAPKENMLKEAQHLDGIPVSIDNFDACDGYLNVQNGIVNLRNGELMPHDPEIKLTKICNCEYEPNGTPHRWLQFLDEITNGDKELQRYLQLCAGYSLTGSTEEQCVFFLYGMGQNGKSTFIDTIANMLGDYASNVQPETLMMKKENGVGTDIARLVGARFVTSDEPTEGVRLNEALIKQLTGGGKVTCRFLYSEEFEYTPSFKAWIATNHKPVIRGTDLGIWRRIRLIPFEVCIPPEKMDKNLKFKFAEELPQILGWAVKGAIEWQREKKLEIPKAVERATAEYRNEMDLLSTFVENCVQITNNDENSVTAAVLYGVFKNWAKDNGEYEFSNRKFGTEIAKKLPEKKRNSQGIQYTGIQLTQYAKQYITGNLNADLFK